MNFKNSIIAPITIVALATACNPVERVNEAADSVDEFHQRYNAGRFGVIWATASSRFKERHPRDLFIEFLRENAAELGEMKESAQVGLFFDRNRSGGAHHIRIVRISTFENAEMEEVFFISQEAGHENEITGYNIGVAGKGIFGVRPLPRDPEVGFDGGERSIPPAPPPPPPRRPN